MAIMVRISFELFDAVSSLHVFGTRIFLFCMMITSHLYCVHRNVRTVVVLRRV